VGALVPDIAKLEFNGSLAMMVFCMASGWMGHRLAKIHAEDRLRFLTLTWQLRQLLPPKKP
jgi:hypothetical protein